MLPDELSDPTYQPVNTGISLAQSLIGFSQPPICFTHKARDFPKLLLRLDVRLRKSHHNLIQLCLVGRHLIEHSNDVLHPLFDFLHTLVQRTHVISV